MLSSDAPRFDRGLPAWIRDILAHLDCRPAEVLGLAVLVSGALAALALLWLLARPEGPAGAGLQFQETPEHSAAAEPASDPPAELTVHVAGRVAAPGVYRLPAASRVTDAIALAGGALEDAALEAVNLARPLTDGEQLLVPGPGVAPVAPAGGPQAPDGPVNLNLTTVDDLDALPGIGPVLAERIIAHRTEVGQFRSVDELRDVSGIGEKTFQDLAPLVTT